MRKVVTLVLMTMLALSLTACAGMGKKEATRVKCPACGYEFEVPATQ